MIKEQMLLNRKRKRIRIIKCNSKLENKLQKSDKQILNILNIMNPINTTMTNENIDKMKNILPKKDGMFVTRFKNKIIQKNRKITIEPKYDIAGPNNICSPNEFVLYNYLNIHSPIVHTGCGGTIFSLKYFYFLGNNLNPQTNI